VDKLALPDHTLIFVTNSKGWVKVINISALLTGSEINMFKEESQDFEFNHFLETKYRDYLFNTAGYFDFESDMFNTCEYNIERYSKFHLALKRKDSISAAKSSENYFYMC
jgi:hypothetical protein